MTFLLHGQFVRALDSNRNGDPGIWIVPSPGLARRDHCETGDAETVDRELISLIDEARRTNGPGLEARVATMARDGKRPGTQLHGVFWVLVLMHARRTGDVPLALRAFQSLALPRSGLASPPARSIEKWREVLHSMRNASCALDES